MILSKKSELAFYGKSVCAQHQQLEKKREQKQKLDQLGHYLEHFTQAPAFEAADKFNEKDTKHKSIVISLEQPTDGKRRFVATTFPRFSHEYFKKTTRHYYEIIRQNSPCRLYYDLEFKIKGNENLNGDYLTAKVIQETSFCLLQEFDIFVHSSSFLVLDSTTKKKFSRHVIVHLPGNALFADNSHCGEFVNKVVRNLGSMLFVKDDDKLGNFVDSGVYTKNRAFRFYLSSKFGKLNTLTPCDFNRFPVNENTIDGVKQLFQDAMVCPLVEKKTSTAKLLTMQAKIKVSNKRKWLSNGGTVTRSASHCKSEETFPFTELELYLKNTIQKHTRDNKIPHFRSWSGEYDANHILQSASFIPGNNRFCFHINRSHKSNHVYYIVNLVDGTIVQRCFDPDCSTWSSIPWKIPNELLPRQ